MIRQGLRGKWTGGNRIFLNSRKKQKVVTPVVTVGPRAAKVQKGLELGGSRGDWAQTEVPTIASQGRMRIWG